MSPTSSIPVPPISLVDAHAVADIVPYMARSLLGLMEDRGLSLERLCRGLGFTHTDLLDRHLLLSHQQVRSLVLRAQLLTRDPALGIASGARQPPVSWGLMGLAMLTCETFGEAIEYGLSQQGAGGAMLHNAFEVRGREAHLEVLPRLFDLEIEGFLVEENFASAVAIGRCLVGSEFAPLRVDLAFAHFKIDIVQRLHAGECLCDATHLENDVVHGQTSGSVRRHEVKPRPRAPSMRIENGSAIPRGPESDPKDQLSICSAV